LRPIWLVDRLWHLIQRGDAPSLRALLDPECRLFENGQLAVAGRDSAASRLLSLRATFPQLAVRIHERVAAGARVLERWTLEALAAEGAGTRPGRLVIHGASWTLCRAGLVLEIHRWCDPASVQRQLADEPPLAPPVPPAFAHPLGAPSAR
jgi:hypothetical protein